MGRDPTGLGDFPMEYLRDNSGLPVDDATQIKFTAQSKSEMYRLWETALFKDAGDPNRFSYWIEDPLAAVFEEQSTRLVRECKTDAELLSPHAPEEPGAYDDACSMVALGCLGLRMGRSRRLWSFSVVFSCRRAPLIRNVIIGSIPVSRWRLVPRINRFRAWWQGGALSGQFLEKPHV